MTNRPTVMTLRVRLITGIAVFAALLAIGTVGYMVIERWSFIDAIFMTVITVTTVGYGEVQPLDTAGRAFTIFLVLFGVGTAIYLLTTFVALVIEGDLGAALGVTRMKSRIDQLRDTSSSAATVASAKRSRGRLPSTKRPSSWSRAIARRWSAR